MRKKSTSDLEAAAEEKVEQSFYESRERKYSRLQRAEYACIGLAALFVVGFGICVTVDETPRGLKILSGVGAISSASMSKYFSSEKRYHLPK